MSQVGVLRFPGTNCDRDVFEACAATGLNPAWLWHADRFDPASYESLFIPGGFSHGDYLRSGALAARAPAMSSVREAAARGTPVLGICNGFQILCEAQLLPGALIRNETLRFIDDWVQVRVVEPGRHFARELKSGQPARLPIAHADGRWVAEADELRALRDRGQVWLTYVTNPNGSTGDVAGLTNEKKNVAALMPHPERALFEWMGGADGSSFFRH